MARDFDKILAASAVFTPGAPIDRKDRFLGRGDELDKIIDTIASPGRHPIVFGQRGVGKTSLANVLSEVARGLLFVKISCDGGDNFETIWTRVLRNATIEFRQKAFGFSPAAEVSRISLAAFLDTEPGKIGPSSIADVFRKTKGNVALIILDEFDKVTDPQTKSYMADLIKAVSDEPGSQVTIVLVGVAKNITELIGHHPSVSRNLVQVEVEKMDDGEITGIFVEGCRKLGYVVDDDVYDELPALSDGFPHYAHLIGLGVAKALIRNEVNRVDVAMFHIGCDIAVQDSIEKYRDLFAKATSTTQVSRYPQILCACGHANHDERGVFRATDVVDAMRRVFNERLTVQAVVPALGSFASPDKGNVLEKVSVGARSHYRFEDPMMRPFLKLKSRSLQFEL